MAKDKIVAKDKIEAADAKAREPLRITIDVDGIKQVTVDCEPGDLEKYWSRQTPAPFLCEDGTTEYTFQVPAQINYASFKQWLHPRTKLVLGTSNKLVLTPSKRNERYVAVYEQAHPVDVVFHATTPKEEILVKASRPDINGITEVTTPGRLTYWLGTQVTFSVPNSFERTYPDVLYGKIVQDHTFLRWEENVTTLLKDRHLPVLMDRNRTLRVLYGQTPRPVTPTAGEVHVLSQQLSRAVEHATPNQGFVVLVNGKLQTLFGRVTFPTYKNAMAALQTMVLQTIPNWLPQATEDWRDWLKVTTQREKFLDYWYKNSVQIVPLSKLTVAIREEPTQ